MGEIVVDGSGLVKGAVGSNFVVSEVVDFVVSEGVDFVVPLVGVDEGVIVGDIVVVFKGKVDVVIAADVVVGSKKFKSFTKYL